MKTAAITHNKTITDTLGFLLALLVMALMIACPQPAQAKNGGTDQVTNFCDENFARAFPGMPASLKCKPAPAPYTLDENGNENPIIPSIIKDSKAAIALGKMLFWDSQVGSDGLACASCHFHAGADNRIKNQINPGMLNTSAEKASDGITPIGNVFDFMASYANAVYIDPVLANSVSGKGPNYTLTKADFPLRKYKEPENPAPGQPLQSDRNAEIVYDSDDVISSQGAYHSRFNELTPKGKRELCHKRFPTTGPGMPIFNVAGYSVRQVEPRNTPSVINAVYYDRNFWDGRANNVFNGLDPFGLRRFANPANTPASEIYIKDINGNLIKERIAIHNASLASQAVGPALSDFEMSCGGKSFPELGKKMLARKPLTNQKIDLSDSVLGSYAKPGVGLKTVHTYKNLIQSAFNNAYWDDTKKVDGYTLTENNFSLFWGLAIQAYEATLVSDDTRFDQAQESIANGIDLLTAQEKNGMDLFFNKGKCINCHSGSELTAASVDRVSNPDNIPGDNKYVERMLMGDGSAALYDGGFYNIGVRPTKEDLGLGGNDPYGFPLSYSRNAKTHASEANSGNSSVSPLLPDPLQTDSSLFAFSTDPVAHDEREAVDGAFKTPALRNVELTGPYFHNGGQATLQQAVEFYNRGGDRKDKFQKDPNCGGALIVDGKLVPDPETGLIDDSGYLVTDSGLGQASNIAPDMAGTHEFIGNSCNPHQPIESPAQEVPEAGGEIEAEAEIEVEPEAELETAI